MIEWQSFVFHIGNESLPCFLTDVTYDVKGDVCIEYDDDRVNVHSSSVLDTDELKVSYSQTSGNVGEAVYHTACVVKTLH